MAKQSSKAWSQSDKQLIKMHLGDVLSVLADAGQEKYDGHTPQVKENTEAQENSESTNSSVSKSNELLESEEARADRLRAQVISMYDGDGLTSENVDDADVSKEAKAWNADPMSTLQPIIKNKSVNDLEVLVKAVPGVATTLFPLDHTALHFIAADGNLELAKILVEAGADVNARNSKNGATPAMYAVPGTVAAGDSGCGDQGRLKTMKYIMSVKAFDSNLQGTQDW